MGKLFSGWPFLTDSYLTVVLLPGSFISIFFASFEDSTRVLHDEFSGGTNYDSMDRYNYESRHGIISKNSLAHFGAKIIKYMYPNIK